MENIIELLVDAIVNYIAGSTRDDILSLITEEQWEEMNAIYMFSSDSYNIDDVESDVLDYIRIR